MNTYSIEEIENKEETDVDERLNKIENNLNKLMETIEGKRRKSE